SQSAGEKATRKTNPAPLFFTFLEIENETFWIFQAFLDADEEGHGFLAVNDAVIVAESKIHHRTDDDLAADDNRTILDLVHAENARLRRIEDRRGHQRAVNTTIGDGEGAALHVTNRKRTVACSFRKPSQFLFNTSNRKLIGIADDRND